MSQLSSLAQRIFKRRAHLLLSDLVPVAVPVAVSVTVVAILLLQPLLVNAKPVARTLRQLAEIAQLTPEPQEEPTDAPPEEDTPAPTATPAEPTDTPLPPDQPNIELPSDEGSDTVTVEIPTEVTVTADEPDEAAAYALPVVWQGDATIPATQLAEVAPPLQAEVGQGDFQIAYVAAEPGTERSGLLRILPVNTSSGPGVLRLGVTLTPDSDALPFPAGQVLSMQFDARLYAPDASTRFVIADEQGSSSTLLQGLDWDRYEVTRQIDDDVTSVEVMLDWRNVSPNAWLELRGLQLTLLPTVDAATLSPTDTPRIIEEIAIQATVPPPQTPTPTAVTLDTATPLATATPLPNVTPVPTAATRTPATDTVVLTPTATLIVVTSTPTPANVFEEATRVAQATEWAYILGPATATPPNLATATPTVTPVVVTNTPVPGNAATATQEALRATAVAFTTGTPTPLPPNAIVLVATPTSPRPTATTRATATPTPIFVLLDDIPVAQPTAPPPVPAILGGKIVFLTAYRGNPRAPNAMVMNPDGTGVGLLTTNFFYTLAAERDAYSADMRFRAYALREGGGTARNTGTTQIFYDDAFYGSTQHQLTYFGDGVAWSPAWSPVRESIVYVSSETENDEIWISERNQWPGRQLTKNDWEWDHHPSFSPDGSEIVFSSNRVTGTRQLWIMSASGENQRQLTNFPFEAWDPVWVKYTGGNGGSSEASAEETFGESDEQSTEKGTHVGK